MSFQHILVPVDGSEISLAAVKQAAIFAKAFESKLTIISIVVEDPFRDSDFYYSAGSAIMKEYFIEAFANAQKALATAQNICAEYGVGAEIKTVKGEVSVGTLIQIAEESKTDLIVMGSHGRKGLQKVLLGSFAQDVLGSTLIPVMIVKQ